MILQTDMSGPPESLLDLSSFLKLILVHGWDSNKNLNFYSVLGLSTQKHAKCDPTMTKDLPLAEHSA